VLKKLSSQKGFTLLELLVVIVVIGILALLVIPNLTSAPKKARDIQRKTDLRAVQKALEEYFVSNSAYPVTTVWATLGTGFLATGTPPILKTMPIDPTNSGVYIYSYNASVNTAYTLRACLENQADVGQYTNADTTNCGTNGRNFTLVNNN
jgi:general secretion pathway protein G